MVGEFGFLKYLSELCCEILVRCYVNIQLVIKYFFQTRCGIVKAKKQKTCGVQLKFELTFEGKNTKFSLSLKFVVEAKKAGRARKKTSGEEGWQVPHGILKALAVDLSRHLTESKRNITGIS